MPNSEFEEKLYSHCGHRLQSHLKDVGQCNGDASDDHSWCIANCKRFW